MIKRYTCASCGQKVTVSGRRLPEHRTGIGVSAPSCKASGDLATNHMRHVDPGDTLRDGSIDAVLPRHADAWEMLHGGDR